MSQSQQKSYAENRKRNLEFEVGDMVYLKIVPMKGGFGKKGKRSPYNVGPYDILKLVENVDYELRLPIYLTHVHSVFHVSMLKKWIGDPLSIHPLQGLGVDEKIAYKEVTIEILVR